MPYCRFPAPRQPETHSITALLTVLLLSLLSLFSLLSVAILIIIINSVALAVVNTIRQRRSLNHYYHPLLNSIRSISEISSCFFGPRPWHIEIRHRVKKTSTINLFGFETLKLKIRRLKLWKPTVTPFASLWVPLTPSVSLPHKHSRGYIYIYIYRERERDIER